MTTANMSKKQKLERQKLVYAEILKYLGDTPISTAELKRLTGIEGVDKYMAGMTRKGIARGVSNEGKRWKPKEFVLGTGYKEPPKPGELPEVCKVMGYSFVKVDQKKAKVYKFGVVSGMACL